MFVRSGKATVLWRRIIGSFDVPQVLAFCVEDLYSSGRRRVSVFLIIDTQSIGATNESRVCLLFEIVLSKISAILQRSIRLDVVGEQIFSAPVVDVERL